MLDQIRLRRFQESRDYRASYIASRVRLAVASQIRVLRAQFSGTQAEFANEIGKPQSVISRLENPDYGQMSVQTLLDIAEPLDIALVVKFVTYDRFFTLLDDDQISPDALRVEPFAATLKRHEQIGASPNVISLGLQRKISDRIGDIQFGDANDDIRQAHEVAPAKAVEPTIQPNQSLYESLTEKTNQGIAV